MDKPKINPNEAPKGFYAVPKKSINDQNICNGCDWRKVCQDKNTDLLAYGHRCMEFPVISAKDGKTYQREDNCSVMFKKL